MASHITALEAASRLWTIRHLARDLGNHSKRHLVLGDNLSAVFSGCKGRATAWALLSPVRASAAVCLAAELWISDRWIMSERNPADWVSRWFVAGPKRAADCHFFAREEHATKVADDGGQQKTARGAMADGAPGERSPSYISSPAAARKAGHDLGGESAEVAGEATFLQRFRLTPATHAKYVLALERFPAYWLLEQLPAWSAVTWDAALQDHVELLFEGGKDRRAASCLTAAVLWLAPGFGRPTTADLPLTVASLRNWTGLEPDFSKPPLPYAIMMSIVLWLATHGQGQAGLLTWMLFETYLRVNEGLTMQTEDLVIAGPLLSGESTAVAVMACSSSRLLAANAEEQDLCLSLDLARHRPLAALLCRWAGLRSGDAQLWDLTYPQLRDAFHQAAVAVGVEELDVSLHSLRHGGASHDRLCNARSPLGVQLRGAWRSSSSLQRYENVGLVAIELGKLQASTVRAANLAAETLLRSSEQSFEPLFDRLQADTVLSWSSSPARVASAQPCAAGAGRASSSTSATARTLTSPTQL